MMTPDPLYSTRREGRRPEWLVGPKARQSGELRLPTQPLTVRMVVQLIFATERVRATWFMRQHRAIVAGRVDEEVEASMIVARCEGELASLNTKLTLLTMKEDRIW